MNLPLFLCSTLPSSHFRRLEHLAPFALICAVHAALLWWLTTTIRATAVIVPPAVVGVLVSEAPKISQPKPLPVVESVAPEPQPHPKPVARPKPARLPPMPAAPPSERAVTAPPPEPPAAPATASNAVAALPPSAAAIPKTADQPPQPVAPPRADATFLNNPTPTYPPLSRRYREEGRVLMDVYILVDGSVGQIRLKRSSGFPRLDEAALNAVRRWRYVPAKRGDVPIDYWHVQPLDFELNP